MTRGLLNCLPLVALCGILGLVCGSRSFAGGPNLMTNAGFEEGVLDNWSVSNPNSPNTFGLIQNSADAHSGSYALQANLNGSWDQAETQVYNLWPNTKYVFSFWVKNTGTVTNSGGLEVRIYGSDWSTRLALQDVAPTTPGSWQQITVPFNSGSFSSMAVQVFDSQYGDATTDYLDDFKTALLIGHDLHFNPKNPSASQFSYLWGDEFASSGTIDMNASGSNGFHWYPQQWYGYPNASPSTYTVSKGAMVLSGCPDAWGSTLHTAIPEKNSKGFAGTVFSAANGSGLYIEARIAFTNAGDAGNSGWPGWWMNAVQGDVNIGNAMPGHTGWNESIEQDIMEYNATWGRPWDYSSTTHDWVADTSSGTTYNLGSGTWLYLNGNHDINAFFARYHTYGLLWVPATAENGWMGYRQPFFDGVPGAAQCWKDNQTYSGAMPPTIDSMGSYWDSMIDHDSFELILGTGTSSPVMSIDYVHVFGTSINSVTTVKIGGATGHPPTGPMHLTAISGSGAVSLTWVASTGASQYNVYRGTSTGAESGVAIGSSAGASYTDTGLASGTTYYYIVAAANIFASSVPSNEAEGTTKASP